MKTKDEILNDLPSFYGTEHYHRWSPFFRNFVLTDGAKYIADACGAYWLMDAIASHLGSYKSEGFAVVKLSRATASNGWLLRIEDGNDGLLADQLIEFTDFPLDEIKLYVAHSEYWVIMLPSEY